ncbi:MAG TPA: PIN domain-containing protein [Vicinamibacterales bacterium]
MIVADTGAVLALFDRRDAHHIAVRALFDADPDAWLLPWAILPEIDYLVAARLGDRAQRLWLDDVVSGAFAIEWGKDDDVAAAGRLTKKYESLAMGLVDAVVMAIAERLGADIATVDLRHFGAVGLKHAPRLLPRDLPRGGPRRR